MTEPAFPAGDGRAKTVLLVVGGLVMTLALVAALVWLWPDDDNQAVVAESTTSSRETEGTGSTGSTLGEPSERTSTTVGAVTPEAPVQLFESGADQAVAEMAAAAGDPDQAIGIAIYPTYAFLAYRSLENPSYIDRRSWRDGEDQDDAAPNPIDDRVNADTEPSLFRLDEVGLVILPALVDDASSRFDLDVEVTHILIDRFLPFDERVLIRVYASPTDGRSGGGYVQYAVDGRFVKVIQ